MEDTKNLSEILSTIISQNGEILSAVMVQGGEIRQLASKVGQLEERITSVEVSVSELKEDVIELKKDVNVLKEDVNKLKEITNKLSTKITNIEITLEIDVVPSIMRVVERHIDFNRRLDKTNNVESKLSASLVMYDLYIRHHESEIKIIKNACNMA